MDPLSVSVAELRGPSRLAAVIARNLYWGRTHGWSNLVEEHDLNLRTRIPREYRKMMWRTSHRSAEGSACPVFLVGAQRSGTNMITYGLAQSPEFQVYNEGNRRAFSNYRLRDNDGISSLIAASSHPFVLFKPLIDTHRIVELLDDIGTGTPPKALWVYRDVRSRTRSALAKFGDSNLRVLVARSKKPDFVHWQLGGANGLTAGSSAILDRHDVQELSAADGAALFWLVRNRVFFELGLDQRNDVMLVSYDRFLESPARWMQGICQFLGFPYNERLIGHVGARTPPSGDHMDIASTILGECDGLSRRLDEIGLGRLAHSG